MVWALRYGLQKDNPKKYYSPKTEGMIKIGFLTTLEPSVLLYSYSHLRVDQDISRY
jgi:hypothetical protein